jgi:DASH complex subunit ASK1
MAVEESHTSSRPEHLSDASEYNADTFNPNRTPSESSFVPAQAAVSSTPAATAARTRRTDDTSFTPLPPGTDPSWGMSLESPLVRLDRELREFARADPQPASTSASIDLFSEADLTVGNVTTFVADETVHGPTPAPAPAPSNTRIVRPTVQTHVPPLSFRRNPATPARNPYIPAHADPRNWSGIVDLRSPQPLVPSLSAATEKEDEPTLPAGMSPPVMVPFATLPSLGRSPAKG